MELTIHDGPTNLAFEYAPGPENKFSLTVLIY